MKLSRYMVQHGLTDEEMSSRIGDVSVSGLRKWLRDERMPRAEQMRRIFEVTDGAVAPNDFVLGEAPASEVSA